MFCFLPESWWPVPCHSQLWEWLSSCPFPTIAQNALPTPPPVPLGVLGHRSQCVGPGFFFFFWEKLRIASVSQATLWIDGGRTSWLGDLGCFVRPQWRVAEGGALPEAIWGSNSMARQGLPPPGPSVGGRAEPRRRPAAALYPAPRPHPAPRPRPTPGSHRVPR